MNYAGLNELMACARRGAWPPLSKETAHQSIRLAVS